MKSGSGALPRSSDCRAAPRSASGRLESLLALAGWFGVTFGAAWFGAQFSPGEWYAGLDKPSWNPPNWIFGPVWTGLYAMMAISAWLVWRLGGFRLQAWPLVVFLIQLALNAVWSWLFFGLRNPALAFVEIVALWVAIGVTLLLFRRRSPMAAWLLVPYLAWVTFAAVLNFTLWRLNLG